MVQHDLLSLQSQAYLNKRGGKEKKKEKEEIPKKQKKRYKKKGHALLAVASSLFVWSGAFYLH